MQYRVRNRRRLRPTSEESARPAIARDPSAPRAPSEPTSKRAEPFKEIVRASAIKHNWQR